MLHDPLCHAADQDVRQASASMSRYDDQICMDLFCCLNNCLIGNTGRYERPALDTLLAQTLHISWSFSPVATA